MNLYTLLPAVALGFVVCEMTVTWLLACRWRNFGIVDVVWSAGFSVIAMVYALLAALRYRDPIQGGVPGWSSLRVALFTGLVVLWSIRLTAHLARRVYRHHPVEDVRYARLRATWGSKAEARMFWFFQLQGILQVVLSIPFLLVCAGTTDPSRSGVGLIWPMFGVAFWTIGWIGESIADAQLSSFRSNPAHLGRVCDVGLWGWSRHPNYFFEWLIWVAYWLYACGSPWGWVAIVAPALILHFLLNVTGIPMTEALSVKSKGEAYRRYQETTSAFVPWPKQWKVPFKSSSTGSPSK